MRDLTVTLRNTTTGRLTRLPIAARNPGIIDPPAVMKVADAPADGERDVPVTVSGDVNAVAHGLARPVVTRDLATDGSLDNLAWRTLRVDEDARGVIAQATAAGGEPLSVGLYRDGDANGRISQEDEYINAAIAGLAERGGGHVRRAGRRLPGRHLRPVRRARGASSTCARGRCAIPSPTIPIPLPAWSPVAIRSTPSRRTPRSCR